MTTKNTGVDLSGSGDEDNIQEAAFRDRLAKLTTQYSIRGLARRLDIPSPNISRYIKKGLPAAAFCRRLVERLGVNPAWLLTGQGIQMLSDIPAATSNTVSDLLELVDAMSAVTRMRLGALAGQQHGQVLRELSDALTRYEELRGKLNTYSESTLQAIIDRLRVAPENNLDQIQSLIKVGEQVSRLCDNSTLSFDLKRMRVHYEFRRGNSNEALRHIREIVFQNFLLNDNFYETGVNDLQNLAATLSAQLQLDEALTYAEVGLVFTKKRGENRHLYVTLLESAGVLDFELGNMARARERLIYAHSRVEENRRRQYMIPLLARIHFHEGIMSYMQVQTFCGRTPAPSSFSSLTLWSEQANDLADNLKKLESYDGPAISHRLPYCKAYVASLLDALRGVTAKKALERLNVRLADVPTSEPFRIYTQPVIAAQIATIGKDEDFAQHWVTEAHATIENAKPAIQLPVTWAAVHYRNILRCRKISKKLHDKALEFFERHINAGYAVFQSALEPLKTKKS